MIIAVDFDGVVFDGFGEMPGAFDTLRLAKNKGHKIILWTCCGDHKLRCAVEFCRNAGVEFDAVNSCAPDSPWFSHPKVFADIYIDDRSFPPFSGWADFKAHIESAE